MAFCSSCLSKTFVGPFLLDLTWMHSAVCRAYAPEDTGKEKRGGNEVGKMEEKQNTWSLVWGIPADCRAGGRSQRKGVGTLCKTLPLAATQELLWEPKVLLACVVLKQTLSTPQKLELCWLSACIGKGSCTQDCSGSYLFCSPFSSMFPVRSSA